MDHYADMPMPSLDVRVGELLKLVKNPTSHHVTLATSIAKQTPDVSLMGYCSGYKTGEQKRFLAAAAAQGGSETSEPS
jgi:hypothetical protein